MQTSMAIRIYTLDMICFQYGMWNLQHQINMHSYSLCHANMTKIHGSHNMITMKFCMKTGNGRLVNTIVPPTVRRVATDARSIIPVESKALGWIWSTSGCGCIFRCWFLLSDVSTFNEHCQRTQAERCNQLDCRVSESCQPYCGFQRLNETILFQRWYIEGTWLGVIDHNPIME